MNAPENRRGPGSDHSQHAPAERSGAHDGPQSLTLAELALQAHAAEIRARDTETKRRELLNDELRSEYTDQLYSDNIAQLRSLVAQVLGLPEDSPVLTSLDWRIEEDQFEGQFFARATDGRIGPATGGHARVRMRTNIEGVPLLASLSLPSGAAQTVHLTVKSGIGVMPITSLSTLGTALEYSEY
ncbi:hypothetical protein C5C03_00320 [Clavibacter michiganensis]|uniref:hypothetical protein n=1 Tax=Clavibacter michiganensis TaxID=28447 RepID=UPI000CE8755D|nr:hypothetical protein [Clavibacter michiganensis]PPF91305.1 hypothetical protein C5C03_00320 [Clavibacter michiganensis]PPF99347.1 hypothetical protein C5C05_02125 [Clavibacter michiganensis]